MKNIFKRFPQMAIFTGLCQVLTVVPAQASEPVNIPDNDGVKNKEDKNAEETALPKAGVATKFDNIYVETASSKEYVPSEDIEEGLKEKERKLNICEGFTKGEEAFIENDVDSETLFTEEMMSSSDNDRETEENGDEKATQGLNDAGQGNSDDFNDRKRLESDEMSDEVLEDNENEEDEENDVESALDTEVSDNDIFENKEKSAIDENEETKGIIYISDVEKTEDADENDKDDNEDDNEETEIVITDIEEIPEMDELLVNDSQSENELIEEKDENTDEFSQKAGNEQSEIMMVRTKGMDYTAEDLYYLAQVIANEAGSASCSDEHQLAVGNVVLNRVKSSKFGNTIRDVVLQPGQYDGDLHRDLRGKLGDFYYMRCVENAQRLLNGLRVLPENALYQANFVQGAGICRVFDSGYSQTYICYG